MLFEIKAVMYHTSYIGKSEHATFHTILRCGKNQFRVGTYLKRFVKYLGFGILIFILTECTSKQVIPFNFTHPEPMTTKKILFYGSSSCGHCQYFSQNMQKEKIPFQFFDVRKDKSKNTEMWDKVYQVEKNPTSISFPVMDIDGKILVSPSYEDFKKALAN